MGKVLAASQSKEWQSEYLRYLRQLPDAKEYWRDNGKKLIQILEDVSDKNYAINNEDLTPGLRSVAAPVRNREYKVVGAVNIAVSSSVYSLERLKSELIGPLQETTRAISAALGYI